MEENIYERQKVVVHQKLSKEYLTDVETFIGTTLDDFVTETLTAELKAHFYSMTIDEKTIYHFCKKPSFLDWLFGRTERVEIKVTASELFKNPPNNGTKIIYTIKKQ